MYDIKHLYEADSVETAIRLRQLHPDAKLIAGGSDVLVQIREGRLAGAELISIHGIDALRGVAISDNGDIRIGCLTSFSHITRSPVIQRYLPVLGDAADTVGGPQIRNIGTIGGNICNGVTSADTASTCFALDASIELAGNAGTRLIPIQRFYIRAGVTDIQDDEVMTAVVIPKSSYENCYGFYQKYSMRNAMDIATLNCSVNVTLKGSVIGRARIAYGVAGPVPMRAYSAEAAVCGHTANESTAELFAKTAVEAISPRDSWRASKAFRTHIAKELAYRGLMESVNRARRDI